MSTAAAIDRKTSASSPPSTPPLLPAGGGVVPDPLIDPSTPAPEMAHNCTKWFVEWVRRDDEPRHWLIQGLVDIFTVCIAALLTATVAGIPFVWLGFQENGVQRAEVFYLTHPPKGLVRTADVAGLKQSLAENEERAEAAEKAHQAALSQLSGAQKEAERYRAQATKLSSDLAQARASAGGDPDQLSQLRQQVDTAVAREQEAAAALAALKQQQAAEQERLDQVTGQHREAVSAVQQLKLDLQRAQTELSRAKQDLVTARKDMSTMKSDAEVQGAVLQATTPLEAEIEKQKAVVRRVQAELGQAKAAAAGLAAKVEAAASSGQAVDQQVARLSQQVQQLTQDLSKKTEEAAVNAFMAQQWKEHEAQFGKWLVRDPAKVEQELTAQVQAVRERLAEAQKQFRQQLTDKDKQLDEQAVAIGQNEERARQLGEQLENDKRKYETQLAADKRDQEKQRIQLAELSKRIQELELKVQDNASLSGDVARLKQENGTLQAQLAEARQAAAAAKADTASAQELARVRAELAQANLLVKTGAEYETQMGELRELLRQVQTAAPDKFKGAFEQNVQLKIDLATATLRIQQLQTELAAAGLARPAHASIIKGPSPAPAEGKGPAPAKAPGAASPATPAPAQLPAAAKPAEAPKAVGPAPAKALPKGGSNGGPN